MLRRFRTWWSRNFGRHRLPSVAYGLAPVETAYAAGSSIERVVYAGGAKRRALARAFADRMRALAPRDWLRIESDLRSPDLEPENVAELAELPLDDAVELLGVASHAASGYVREAALRALQRLGHPRALPYVLLRLGDWVEPVRSAAADALRSLLELELAAELIAHHRLVERLARVARVDLARSEAEIRTHLLHPRSRSALEAGLAAEQATTRLFCLRMLEGELASQPMLGARALGDRDPAVRAWIAAKVVRGELEVAEEACEALLCDRSARVAVPMIRALTPQRIARHRAALLELALADARPVRESARAALERQGPIDLAELCRRALDASGAEGAHAGWIACLGEQGDARDFGRLLAFLEHERPRMRAAAAAALARIDRERAAPSVAFLLADPSGRVRRVAASVLRRVSSELWSARAYAVAASGSEKCGATAIGLLARTGGWNAVPGLLHGLASDHEAAEQRAWQGVVGWMQRHGAQGWLAPSDDCRAALARIWPSVRPRGDAPQWAEVPWRRMKAWIERVLST